MSAIHEDEVSALDEAQMSARLHQAMSGLSTSPTLAATVHRQHARRALGMRIAVTGSVAAVLAIAGTVAFSPRSSSPVVGAPPSAPAMIDVAFVANNMAAAQAAAGDSVLKSHEVLKTQGNVQPVGGRTVDAWTDTATKQWHEVHIDASGTTLFSAIAAADSTGITMDHKAKTWWKETFNPNTYTEQGFGLPTPPVDAADLQKAQTSGKLKLIGTENVNGRDAFHLQWSVDPSITKDFWADTSTYQLVKASSTIPNAVDTIEFTWLPRTPENLAQFELKAPAGFTQITNPNA